MLLELNGNVDVNSPEWGYLRERSVTMFFM
jgi:hypothetical protein